MAGRQVKVGNVVRVSFLDHSMGNDIVRPVECYVTGYVFHVDKKAIHICCWWTEEGLDHNAVSFAILRSAITNLKILERLSKVPKKTS